MKLNFNQPIPAEWQLPASAAAMQQSLTAQLATQHHKILDASLRNAILRHIGYMPEPEELKQRAHCIMLPDGTHCFLWDGKEFHRINLELQFTPGPHNKK